MCWDVDGKGQVKEIRKMMQEIWEVQDFWQEAHENMLDELRLGYGLMMCWA